MGKRITQMKRENRLLKSNLALAHLIMDQHLELGFAALAGPIQLIFTTDLELHDGQLW